MKKNQGVSGVCRRYARALLRMYGDDINQAAIALELLEPISALFQQPEAESVLSSPVMPLDLKSKLLTYGMSLNSKSDENLTKFLAIVSESGRVSALPGIIQAYTELLNTKRGRTVAKVISASPLQPAQLERIKASIADGKNVELNNSTDPKILGGFILSVGHQQLDLSLRSQLNQLAKASN